MRKLLLLLFLFSISSNVFADEFEEFEEVAERKYITCFKDGATRKYSTDGKNLYDGYDKPFGEGYETPPTIIKKPGALKFIAKPVRWGLGFWDLEKDEYVSSYADSIFLDFEDANMIVSDNGTKEIWTCTKGNF